MTYILAICFDCGDTLADEATEVKDKDGATLHADLIPGAADVVRELRRRGYPLALVADGPPATFHNILTQHDLLREFSVFAISGELGVEKPDARMFHHALDQLGVDQNDYGRVLMVGNNLARDVKGANAVGLISVWLDWAPRRSKIPADASEAPDFTIKQPADLINLTEQLEQTAGRHAIEIVCHKGANEYAPENTYAAAQLCIDWGVDYVEIDVNTSQDGVLYMMHGPSVDATTNGSGEFGQLMSHEIDRLDAGSWFGPQFSGERVPRLESFLRWIKGKAKVFLDVKAADLEALIALVYEVGMEEECFFWFGDPEQARQFRERDDRLALKVNVRNAADVVAAHEMLAASIVELSLDDLNEDLVAACRQRGIKIMVYEKEKNPETYRAILNSRADMVNLNHGDLFLQLAQNHPQSGCLHE